MNLEDNILEIIPLNYLKPKKIFKISKCCLSFDKFIYFFQIPWYHLFFI